jgi:carbonic anhydrase/acetyltransferase-like protein (isoleucine patch superfamily)
MYVSMVLISLVFAKACLVLVNLLHEPREGVFLRDEDDKDYRYWSLRNTIKKWPVWLSHKFPFPFMDNICLKVFNVKTTFSNSLFEGWVDTEFIEFGENVTVGKGSIIQSAVIAGNLFIIHKTKIDDNAIIGAHSIIMPGTNVGKNCILAASSVTTVNQELEEGWIYSGIPAEKDKKNRFFEDDLEPLLREPEKMEEYEEKQSKSED